MSLLSIITINYNNSEGLKKTLKSVAEQNYTDYEQIIIDGGSTDKSTKIIEEYDLKFRESGIAFYGKSEPDNGVYHAMNKGISKANGKYILFLNSGDYLYEKNTLSNVSILLEPENSEDILYGDLMMVELDDSLKLYKYPDTLKLSFFFNSSLPHQATFIKRQLFYEIGMYDESLKVVSDWKFFFEAILFKGKTYRHMNKTISYFVQGGINHKFRKTGIEERENIFKHCYPHFYPDILKYRELLSREKYINNSKLFAIPLIFEKIKDNLRKKINRFK